MRSLTIGALIVCGGTIAALPFRRAAVDPATHESVSRLDGRIATELAITNETVAYDPWFVDPHSGPRTDAERTRSSSAMSLASQTHASESIQSIHSDALARPRRDLRLPLTYDDLAVPLTATEFRDGRFDALANRQTAPAAFPAVNGVSKDRHYQSMRVAADDPTQVDAKLPPWQMASDLPQSILNKTPSTQTYRERPAAVPSQPSAVVGRLASDARPRELEIREEPAPARERHWIRQPD